MSTLLVKNALVLATMDDARREIAGGGLFVRDNVIEQVGPTAELPPTADTVLDLRDHVVLPGLVNTHHHLYQSLTRVIAQDADLFTWLKTLYPIWANLTDEAIYVSTITGLAELALSGCTTSSDHLYIYPNDCTLDSQIRAAADIGLRFHAGLDGRRRVARPLRPHEPRGDRPVRSHGHRRGPLPQQQHAPGQRHLLRAGLAAGGRAGGAGR